MLFFFLNLSWPIHKVNNIHINVLKPDLRISVKF